MRLGRGDELMKQQMPEVRSNHQERAVTEASGPLGRPGYNF